MTCTQTGVVVLCLSGQFNSSAPQFVTALIQLLIKELYDDKYCDRGCFGLLV